MTDNSGLAETGVPSQFERNRYFDGKLLTARDMAADQTYHRSQLQAIVRGTLGVGIVTGLEVTAVTETDSRLRAAVQPGVALDAAGRPIVVPPATGEVTVRAADADRPFDADEVAVGDVLALQLNYDACATERLPVTGAEHVTGNAGEHGRVVESFVLEAYPAMTDASSDPVPPKPVPEVSMSDPDEDPAFDRKPSTVPLVLAWVKKTDTGDWTITTDGRPLVYPTDLAYAAAVTHATDRENPHDVDVGQVDGAVASVGGATPADGTVDVRTDSGPLSVSASGSELVFDSDAVRSLTAGGTTVPAAASGSVTLTSSNGSVSLSADPGNNAVNLTAATVDEEQFIQELAGLDDHGGSIDLVSTDESIDIHPEPELVNDPKSTLDIQVSDEFKKRLGQELEEMKTATRTLSKQVEHISQNVDKHLRPVTAHPKITLAMASQLSALDIVTLKEFAKGDTSEIAAQLDISEKDADKLQTTATDI